MTQPVRMTWSDIGSQRYRRPGGAMELLLEAVIVVEMARVKGDVAEVLASRRVVRLACVRLAIEMGGRS